MFATSKCSRRDDVFPTVRTTNAPSRHDAAHLPVGGREVGRTGVEEAMREDDPSHALADGDRDGNATRRVDGDEAPLRIRPISNGIPLSVRRPVSGAFPSSTSMPALWRPRRSSGR